MVKRSKKEVHNMSAATLKLRHSVTLGSGKKCLVKKYFIYFPKCKKSEVEEQ